MDKTTIDAYDANSAKYAKNWAEQPAPDDMYRLLQKYFSPGLTVDVGCGSGRDVAWLRSNGYDAIGCDASEGLLRLARETYPGAFFNLAVLPDLAELRRGIFQNALCETVLMHLDASVVPQATTAILDLLVPGGVAYFSWRVTSGDSQRDDKGRLYSAFDKSTVIAGLAPDDTILFDQAELSESSGKTIHRLIVRRAV